MASEIHLGVLLDHLRESGMGAVAPESAQSSQKTSHGQSVFLTFSIIVLCSILLFFTAIALLDNVHLLTGNGTQKSPGVDRWVRNAPDREIDLANLLYYPLHGETIRALLPES